MKLTIEQKESLRHAALEALAVRAPAALGTRQLFRIIKKEVDFLFEETDLEAALAMLVGFTPSLAVVANDELGSSPYWSATTAGVLKYERQ